MEMLDLAVVLQEQVPTWREQILMWLGANEAQTTAFRNITMGIGIIVGGTFALYKFVFEGAFSKRLQPSAAALVAADDKTIYLRVSVTAENIGKRKITLDNEFTKLSVSFAVEEQEDWTKPETGQVLDDQEWVQPGEVVSDQVWVEIPSENIVAVQLEFYVTTSMSMIRRRSAAWRHREIVSLVEKQGTIVSKDER